jgi:hypothetical protein
MNEIEIALWTIGVAASAVFLVGTFLEGETKMRRPNGAPFRPGLSFRVDAAIYEALRTAADQSGRSIAEAGCLALAPELRTRKVHQGS